MTGVKANFPTKFEDIICDLCPLNIVETDSHLLDCPKLIENCSQLNKDIETEYPDIFNEIESQIRAIKIYKAVFESKEKIEETC